MFKITTEGTSIQKVIDVLEPYHFIFDKGSLYVILYIEINEVLQKIKKKKICNIFVEEITELNFKNQPEFIQQEFINMQIQNDCMNFENKQQEKLRDIKQKLVNLNRLLEKQRKEGE